ncbi:hypothetical protein CY35_04G043900 [Sphagnum magellanicum]|nr:hypothetical protein CY35_04G043900 [Sphagnum magellanicum]
MARARLSIATLMSVAAAFMLLVTLPMSTLATSYVVGDGAGWSVPSSPMFYAEWVNKHSPFHIGDTLDFQYAGGDSVLLVNENDYNMCNVWNPISSWINGPHSYELTIPTSLFFISGSAGSCRKGELVAFPVIAAAA